MKLSDAPLPPSPTIQPPALSTRAVGDVRERADVMGGNFWGPYVRVLDCSSETNSRDSIFAFVLKLFDIFLHFLCKELHHI